MTDWENIPEDISQQYGFVYEIMNLITAKRYIGKKFYWSTQRKPPLKKSGKKRDRISKVETDWKEYYGSCKELTKDIEKYGKDNFRRVILASYPTRFECAYYEIKTQIENEVLFQPQYYNGIINCRLRRPGKRG